MPSEKTNILNVGAIDLIPSVATNDLVPIWDTSAGKLASVAVSNLAQGGQGATYSGTVTVVTAVNDNAGTMQYKDRLLTFVNGLLTTVGAESAFTNFP